MRCPRAGACHSRTRAASGPRSTGTKTGPHGACLTAASLSEAGKTPVSRRRGKPGSGAEPSGGTGGECRQRERRKAGAPSHSAQPRKQMSCADRVDLSAMRTLVGQCAFRRSASPYLPEADSKRFAPSFRLGGSQNSGADHAPRERFFMSSLPGNRREAPFSCQTPGNPCGSEARLVLR